MFDRRTLLSTLFASALLPETAGCAFASPRRKIAIVGAGIAGLGAAAALRAAGMEAIVVEARDRLGGRIHSSNIWPDQPIDMGASWIHGVKGNPLTALAAQAGAVTVMTSYDSARLYIDPALRGRGVHGRGTAMAEDVVERALGWADRQQADVSLQAALDAVSRPGTLDLAKQAQLDFHISSTYEQEYSGSARQLSAWTMDDGDAFGGEDALFPGGYGQIVSYLASGLDVRLNRVVTHIVTRREGVTLHFADGGTLAADEAIVTVPLGVLKAGGILFDPPLSPARQRAIDGLGMGLLNKHWLRFDRIFWDKHIDWHEYLSARKGEWSEWVSLAKVNDMPVLVVFSAADHAERIETLDDRAIVADIMATARTMFGTGIPDPIATQISRWRADPFSRGSYSFNAVGSGPEDRKALAESDGTPLHLAGEATSHRHPGTVHGALMSGQETAARIIARRR